MSDPAKSRRKYTPFPALLATDQIAFIAAEAARQRTSKNAIVRKSIDYYRSFLTSISTDRNGHPVEQE